MVLNKGWTKWLSSAAYPYKISYHMFVSNGHLWQLIEFGPQNILASYATARN